MIWIRKGSDAGRRVEWPALLVERQWLWQENRGLTLRLKTAQLKISASLEALDYRSSRGLKRAQIEQLRASAWVKDHRNGLITGPTNSTTHCDVWLARS